MAINAFYQAHYCNSPNTYFLIVSFNFSEKEKAALCEEQLLHQTEKRIS
jgi:hypothetical protein